MPRLSKRVKIIRVDATGGQAHREDAVVAEEPFELRLGGRPLTVTMRTPGNDVELAHGFLLSEGVIRSREDVVTATYCGSVDDEGHNTYNVLNVTLSPDVPPPSTDIERNFYTTSSCGICGKASLEAVRLSSAFPVRDDPTAVPAQVLGDLPSSLRQAQRMFDVTGGLHAAGLFTADGRTLVVREDVGRHNAVDKVLGWALLDDRVPLAATILLVSGRASFELVQKAVMAGVPMLAAVSAPSSLAVDLARESGLTLVGFLREGTMNVYSHPERVLG